MIDSHITSALLRFVELKDESTVAHTWRVALYSQALAEAAGLSREAVHRVMHGAVLHDIGKIDLPDAILAKSDGLTPEEFEVVKSHTVLGYDRLVGMGVNDEVVLAIVRSHHERWDGSGYPDGLRDVEIPEPARQFAVIDSFDAMTSLRPYRREIGRAAAARAVEELQRYSGVWYCPESVTAFLKVYQTGVIDWIQEHFNDEASLNELSAGPDPETIILARQHLLEREGQTRIER